jgi:8-oxo-dGTP diphosphatase
MVLRDNRVMLGKRKGSHGAGSYAWCGGGLEFGESLEEAVARELEQESGLVLTRAELFCVSNIREYDRHYIDFEFLVEATGEPVHREPRKSGPWQWYSLDRLPTPLFRPVEIALRSHRRRRPGQVVYNE